MIHDKRYIDIVEERILEPGKKARVSISVPNIWVKTAGTYGMAVDEQSGLLYSTHPSKRIDIFTPDAIREGVTFKRVDQLTYAKYSLCLGFL